MVQRRTFLVQKTGDAPRLGMPGTPCPKRHGKHAATLPKMPSTSAKPSKHAAFKSIRPLFQGIRHDTVDGLDCCF
jgi:hypothetical protein